MLHSGTYVELLIYTIFYPLAGMPAVEIAAFGQRLILLSQERLAITDAHVEYTLRSQDAAQGKWLNEDPSLAQIQHILMSRQ